MISFKRPVFKSVFIIAIISLLISDLKPQNYPNNFQKRSYQASSDNSIILQNEIMDIIQILRAKEYTANLSPADDQASGIAMDSSGNIYVAGLSTGPLVKSDFIILKHNSTGEITRVILYSEDDHNLLLSTPHLHVDQIGNIYISGDRSISRGLYYEHYDIITIKYNSAGEEQWKVHYHEAGSDGDQVQGIAVDRYGNVIVTGYSHFFDESKIITETIKYNADGKQIWIIRYVGPRGLSKAQAIATDRNSNIYVTCLNKNIGYAPDYTTIKYNTDGVEQWVAHYNGPSNEGDEPSCIVVDDHGNVYVTGRSMGATYAYDIATVKYNSNGEEQWVARYEGVEGPWDDQPTALEVDMEGNVYVAGWSRLSGHFDYITLKYNSEGEERWRVRYDGAGASSDKITDLKLDPDGNICVTGWTDGLGGTTDYLTLKYNSVGEQIWEARYRLGYGDDVPQGLVIDTNGYIYVTGTSYGLDTGNDITTVKYNAMGKEEWVSRWDWGSYFPFSPNNYYLYQNYPNPFNLTTKIEFYLPEYSEVSLKIFNILGENITSLVSDNLSAGSYSYEWDASHVTCGIYLYQLSAKSFKAEAEHYVETKKMILIR